MSKNGLNKHIAEESRKDLEPFIALSPELYEISMSKEHNEYLDKLIGYAAELSDLDIFKTFATQKTFDTIESCNHKWKKYTGLSESFTYCEVCDEKK